MIDARALLREMLLAIRDDPKLRTLAQEIVGKAFGDRAGASTLVDARSSGVGPRKFRALVKAGAIRGFKVGRRIMAKRSEVEAWIAAQQIEPIANGKAPSDPLDRLLARTRQGAG